MNAARVNWQFARGFAVRVGKLYALFLREDAKCPVFTVKVWWAQ